MNQHWRASFKRVIQLLAVLVIGAAVGHFASGELAGKKMGSGELDHGYALLYNLMEEESEVDKLLIISSPGEPLPSLLKEISKTAAAVVKEMDAWKANDPSLNLSDTGLPKIEVKTRSSIADMRTEQLLLDGGETFERILNETQASATNYAWHLAKILAENESNSTRAQSFAKWRDQWKKLSQATAASLVFSPEKQANADKSEDESRDPILHRGR